MVVRIRDRTNLFDILDYSPVTVMCLIMDLFREVG